MKMTCALYLAPKELLIQLERRRICYAVRGKASTPPPAPHPHLSPVLGGES